MSKQLARLPLLNTDKRTRLRRKKKYHEVGIDKIKVIPMTSDRQVTRHLTSDTNEKRNTTKRIGS